MRFVLACMVVAGCGGVQHTYHGVMAMELETMIVCDYGQTIWASNGGSWDRMLRDGYVVQERNPLLGQHPSQGLITTAVWAALIVNPVIYHLPIPPWVKTAFYTLAGAAETYTVATNSAPSVCGM